jgi:hypothetical protein
MVWDGFWYGRFMQPPQFNSQSLPPALFSKQKAASFGLTADG